MRTASGPVARALGRRPFLQLAGVGLVSLAGCLESPSSAPPPYATREIDDGPCFAPGLQDERPMAFYAGLVTAESAAEAFDLGALPSAGDRAFIESTDFRAAYLGVAQVSGVSSSASVRLVDLAAAPQQLGLVLSLVDETPRSDDHVITTFLVRVERERPTPPERIWVQLSIGDRTETFSGA